MTVDEFNALSADTLAALEAQGVVVATSPSVGATATAAPGGAVVIDQAAAPVAPVAPPVSPSVAGALTPVAVPAPAPAGTSTTALASVSAGQLVRVTRPTVGVSPDPQIAALVLSVTPATATAPQTARIVELGRESTVASETLFSV
jgi:hypothetical protein